MNADQNLEFNKEQFKENLMKDISVIDRTGRILKMEPYPSPLVLAQLAEAVYSDGGDKENMPEGWKILTVVFNNSRGNGYCGAAYFNSSLQQLVISHRGTDVTNLGSLWTDIKGVLCTHYTSQMNSAITFSDLVMRELCEVHKMNGVRVQVSVTGHSLGGWLAQVTAFTLKYLELHGDHFVKVYDTKHDRHVHAVSFDSPGSRDILKKIIDDGYCRYWKTAFFYDLDITNYLAPPNIVNTAGSHVGTIYEVCMDLSNMSEIKKIFLYTKYVHQINNFVNSFKEDREIREVLDWPVNTAEYKAHFKKDFIAGTEWWTTWEIEHRYKTIKVDTNSCNLRVFSETELYLLKMWSALKLDSLKLNRINKFVKEHNLVKGQLFAEFKIDTKSRKMTCRSKSELQTVVRHIKLLMRWFYVEFTEVVKLQSKQVPRAGALTYRNVTQNYLDTLPECQMHFEDTIGLKSFLESSNTNFLPIITKDCQFEVTRLRDLLSQMRDAGQLQHLDGYLSEDNQTFMNLKHIQSLEQTIDLEKLYHTDFLNETLIIIDCASSIDVNPVSTDFIKRIRSNVNKKLICVISEQSSSNSLYESPNTPNTPAAKEFCLTDLTEESQKEFFERKMLIVKGKKLSWADYVGLQNSTSFLLFIVQYIDSQMLKNIVTNRQHTIQMKDTVRNNLLPQLYMKRKFRHQIIFNLETFAKETEIDGAIFVFQNETDKQSLLRLLPKGTGGTFFKRKNVKIAASAEEADDIARECPDMPVHIVQREASSGQFLWQRSRGSLDTLRPFVTTGTGDSKDEFALCETNQKIVIIEGEPGMGKSTSLVSMSRLLNESNKNLVIWIDLKHFPIQQISSENESMCISFLYRENIIQDSWTRRLLKFCLEHEHCREVYLIFDGFDEIKENAQKVDAKNKVLQLLKHLSNETTAKIWVTTRLCEKEMLENALSTFAVTFDKIDERRQWKYFENYWRSLLEPEDCRDTTQSKLDECVQKLYANTKVDLGEDIHNFMAIPLQMKILAEVYLPQVKDYINAKTDIENVFEVGSLSSLYENFIKTKYNIYFKTRPSAGINSKDYEIVFDIFTKTHRMLGFSMIFPNLSEYYYEDFESKLGEDELNKMGLVQSGGGNVDFIHRILAEYFCADQIVHWLSKKGPFDYDRLVEKLLTDILLRSRHKIIRKLMNSLLSRQPMSATVQKNTAEQIGKLWVKFDDNDTGNDLYYNSRQHTILHLAVVEKNDRIVDFLVEGFIKFVAAHDKNGDMALGLASQEANINNEASMKIMETLVRSIDSCSREIILKIMLKTLSNSRPSVLGDYLKDGSVCKNVQTAFTRAQIILNKYVNSFFIAVKECRGKDVKIVFEKMENDIERHHMLFARDEFGNTGLHIAAQAIKWNGRKEKGYLPVIKFLVKKKVGESTVINSRDKSGNTVLHIASDNGNLPIVKYLIKKGVSVNLKNKFGNTALHIAAENGYLSIVKSLVEKEKDFKDTDGQTALHLAIKSKHLSVVKFLVSKNRVDVNCMDSSGHIALHAAAEKGYTSIVNILLEKGATVNSADSHGRTALFMAAKHGHHLVVNTLVEKKANLNSIDNNSRTALFMAAKNGHHLVVKILVNEKADLNVTDSDGRTALSIASIYNQLKVVNILHNTVAHIDPADKEGQEAQRRNNERMTYSV